MDSAYAFLMNHALEFAVSIPAAVIALLPVRGRFRRKPATVYASAALLLCAFIIIGSFICVYFVCPSNWVIFAFMPLLMAVYSYVIDLNVGKTVTCFLMAGVLSSLATLIGGILCASIAATNYSLAFLPQTSLACIAINVLLIVLFYRTLTVKLPMLLTNEDIDGAWYTTAFAAFVALCLCAWINPLSYSTLLEGRLQTIALVFLVIAVLVLLYIIDVVWRLASHAVENANLRQENSLLTMEERRLDQLVHYMNDTRALRHDFRQHLRVIANLAHSGQTEELETYVDQLEDVSATHHTRLCANNAVDAVAAYYEDVAEAQGAHIEWSLEIPEGVFIKEAELCSLLGNLVENSLQAVEPLPEEQQIVKVTAHLLTEAMMGITVKNPYQGRIRMGRDGLPRTKRRDHGIGLTSVRSIVNRYDGTMEIDTKGGVFAVNILMYGAIDPASA